MTHVKSHPKTQPGPVQCWISPPGQRNGVHVGTCVGVGLAVTPTAQEHRQLSLGSAFGSLQIFTSPGGHGVPVAQGVGVGVGVSGVGDSVGGTQVSGWPTEHTPTRPVGHAGATGQGVQVIVGITQEHRQLSLGSAFGLLQILT